MQINTRFTPTFKVYSGNLAFKNNSTEEKFYLREGIANTILDWQDFLHYRKLNHDLRITAHELMDFLNSDMKTKPEITINDQKWSFHPMLLNNEEERANFANRMYNTGAKTRIEADTIADTIGLIGNEIMSNEKFAHIYKKLQNNYFNKYGDYYYG